MIDLRGVDCLELLKTLDDESIDLVLTDPPYFNIISHQWDNQWTTEQEYLTWCEEWTSECVRVLRRHRCMYVWGTTKTDTFLKYKLQVLNAFNEMHYRNWIIWSYDWGGRTKKTFPRKHEDLLMYSKGADHLFNADDVRIPYKMKSNVRKTAVNNPLGKIPTDVWPKNNHTTSKEYCGWHPTQKPVQLLERIILANTNEGDTVLDIFSGSGSTALAAKNTGRNFVGCELDSVYFRKSLERLTG
jgi:site-specific DNA-methyltransferase (adenine-specific)|tara:strand:- start:73 stop:801 length:729 start_codon:yes stop_codon:yes gene_type:complete